MSSTTPLRRSPRLAEKMASTEPLCSPLRRSPRLAQRMQQNGTVNPVNTFKKTDEDAFAKSMIRNYRKLRKYYARFVKQFGETINRKDLCQAQKNDICFIVRLNQLAEQYPISCLAGVFKIS